MNLFKRIAVIAIAAILVLTLAACTSPPAEPEEQESSSDQPEVVTIKVGLQLFPPMLRFLIL